MLCIFYQGSDLPDMDLRERSDLKSLQLFSAKVINSAVIVGILQL